MEEAIEKIETIEQEDHIVANRYDFIVLVSSKNGNINGDPDNGNAPRIDTNIGFGVASDVSFKGHVRRAVKQMFNTPIFMDKENGSVDTVMKSLDTGKKVNNAGELCKRYWDIRAFGGVFGNDSSAITGPVQVSMGMTIHPISVHEVAINRCIPNKEEKVEKGGSQFGDKPYQTYGLYQFIGSIDPFKAKVTGFDDDDMEKLFEGMNMAYTLWTSAQKGEAETVKIVVFKHDNALGKAKVSKLKECVSVRLKDGVTVPTDYSDYEITVDESKVPNGVTVRVID